MLCLVLAAVGKVLMTLKEKDGFYPDLTSHGSMSQIGILYNIHLPVKSVQDFLISKLFLIS